MIRNCVDVALLRSYEEDPGNPFEGTRTEIRQAARRREHWS